MPRGTPPAPPLAFSRAGRCARARPATPPAPARVTGVLGGRLPHGLRWWLRHGCLGRVVRCVGRGPRRRLPSQVIRGQPPARLPPGVDVQGCAHLPGLGSPHSRLHLELRTRGWQTGGTPETSTPKPRGRPPPSLADPHVGKAGCRPPAWGGLSDRGAGQAPSPGRWPPAPFVTPPPGLGGGCELRPPFSRAHPQVLRSLPGRREHFHLLLVLCQLRKVLAARILAFGARERSPRPWARRAVLCWHQASCE